MDREDIIKMALEAHGPITGKWWDMDVAALKRFAALVAAHEREQCAKVCEAQYAGLNSLWSYQIGAAKSCAAAIRARGGK
jgi:hypothetical protein